MRTYMLFHNLNIGVADESQRKQILHDLLPMRKNMAAKQTDFGHVRDYKFTLDLTTDVPVQSKPTRLFGEAREWLRNYLKDLCAQGIIA